MEGKAKKNLSPSDCKIAGRESARLHEITKNFHFKRQNDLSVKSWRKIFDQVKNECNKIHSDLPRLIEGNLIDVEKIGQIIYLLESFMQIFSTIIFFF